MGYIAAPILAQITLPFALVPNVQGQLTSPLSTLNPLLQNLTDTVTFDSFFQANLVDQNISGIYPILGFAYLLINPDVPINITSECESRREAFKFLRFSLFPDNEIRNTGISVLYLLPSEATSQLVYGNFSDLECMDTPLLEPTIIDDHSSAIFPVLLAFAMFFLFVLIGSGIYFVITIPGVRKSSMIRFTFCLLFGGFLNFFVCIFWYLVPQYDYVCQIRQWLSASGLTLMATALAARNWNLLQIFLRRKDFFSYESSDRDINILMTIIFLLQLVLLIVWTSVDFLSAQLLTLDLIQLEYSWECSCSNWGLWLGLEIALLAVILLFMVSTVYFVWKFSADIVGHKYTVMSIYNLIMIFAILIVIFATVTKTDRQIAIAAMIGLISSTVSTLFLNFHVSLIFSGGTVQGSSKTGSKSSKGGSKG